MSQASATRAGVASLRSAQARVAWAGAEVGLVHAAPAEVRMDLPTHEVGVVLDPATDHEAWVDRAQALRPVSRHGLGGCVARDALGQALALAWPPGKTGEVKAAPAVGRLTGPRPIPRAASSAT